MGAPRGEVVKGEVRTRACKLPWAKGKGAGLVGGEASYRKVTRTRMLTRAVTQTEALPSSSVRAVRSPLLVQERDISACGNFLYSKGTFPSQKEDVGPVSRAFLASAGSQWPVAQDNPYANEACFGVACSGSPQLPGSKAHVVRTPRVPPVLRSVRVPSPGNPSVDDVNGASAARAMYGADGLPLPLLPPHKYNGHGCLLDNDLASGPELIGLLWAPKSNGPNQRAPILKT